MPLVLIVLLIPFMLAACILSFFLNLVGRMEAKRNAPALIAAHINTLARKRLQMVTADEYGVENTARWQRERSYFINSVVKPALSFVAENADIDALLAAEIEDQLDAYGAPVTLDASPVQYEQYCAEILRHAGWRAQVTKGSGEQGADVIATLGELKLILQCKLYNHTVSNKAVQEAYAAKTYYGATHAAVVTNLSYTASARRLASTNNVELLHHDNLAAFAITLAQSASSFEKPAFLRETA